MQACDDLFAAKVRALGYCQACGSTQSLQCAHGFSRSYKRIRTDFRNAFCLCAHCHVYFTHRPLEWEDWRRERWGEALYAELRTLALSYERVDWRAELARLREAA